MSFLSNLLPTIVGAGVGAMTMNPMAGAAAAGALGYAQTGSLQKGLLAGLAGYSGANLAAGLGAAGTAQATDAIGQSAGLAGEEAAKQAAADYAAKQSAFDALGKQAVTPQAIEQIAAKQAAFNAVPQSALEQSAREFASNAYTPTAAQTAALNSPIQTGLSNLGTKEGWAAFTKGMGGATNLGLSGLGALSPLLTSEPQTYQAAGDSAMPQRLKYNQGTASPFPMPDVPGYDNLGQDFGRQRSYFPGAGYEKISDEEAKRIRGYATGGYADGGGPVEQMSNANAIGMNTGYPQADITGHAYATPWQTPVSQNVVSGTADTGVNRMTGQMLAGGGSVDLHGTINLGGGEGGGNNQFGQGSANGYQPVGSGGGMMGGGLDPRAVAANPQGFQDFLQQAQQREQQYPGSTFLSQGGGMMGQPGPFTGNNNAATSGLSLGQQLATIGSGIGGMYFAEGGMAHGGSFDLGGYSDGGRLLRGPGDGVSDSIPATIGHKQPARLADGEFVVPARIVSELGNGSTEAGARKLYAMMDRVQSARGKTVGKGKVAKNSRADRYLPA